MPRVSREQTQRHRAAIEDAAATLVREQGLHGIGVAQVMAAAGLTHGGFYGHFASKDALAAAACSKAFEASAERRARRVAGAENGRQAIEAIVNGYLSPSHRDEVGSSCPAAALCIDVAREPAGKPVRDAYVGGLKDMVAHLGGLMEISPAQRERLLATMATMVGGLLLARATEGDALSQEFLDAARRSLLDASG